MSRKPVPARAGDSARLEITFDRPQLLGRLFGEYDKNLIAIEHREVTPVGDARPRPTDIRIIATGGAETSLRMMPSSIGSDDIWITASTMPLSIFSPRTMRL